MKTGSGVFIFSIFYFLFSIFCLTSCGPKYSYPAGTVPKSIETICKKENKIDVKARVVGKTVGAQFFMDSSLDPHTPLNRDVNEMMGKVMQAVTRVALSTDMPLDYCAVFVRDRVHETELSIVRSVDDIKRAYADALGIEESMRRTVINQAKFHAAAGDVFVLKEITQEIFLAEQAAQRARQSLSKNLKEEDDANPVYVLVEGTFRQTVQKRIFHLSIVSLKADEPQEAMLTTFKSAVEVLKAYQYDDFDEIQIEDYLNRQKLSVTRQTYLDYQAKKIADEDLMERFVSQTNYPQGGIRLFGFDLAQDSNDSPQGAATPNSANVK